MATPGAVGTTNRGFASSALENVDRSKILDGRAVAARIRRDLKVQVERLAKEHPPVVPGIELDYLRIATFGWSCRAGN